MESVREIGGVRRYQISTVIQCGAGIRERAENSTSYLMPGPRSVYGESKDKQQRSRGSQMLSIVVRVLDYEVTSGYQT